MNIQVGSKLVQRGESTTIQYDTKDENLDQFGMMQQPGVLPVNGRLASTLATETRWIPVEQSYLASPSRFPVATDLTCRVISASEA
jgi:hypothetical protein